MEMKGSLLAVQVGGGSEGQSRWGTDEAVANVHRKTAERTSRVRASGQGKRRAASGRVAGLRSPHIYFEERFRPVDKVARMDGKDPKDGERERYGGCGDTEPPKAGTCPPESRTAFAARGKPRDPSNNRRPPAGPGLRNTTISGQQHSNSGSPVCMDLMESRDSKAV